MGLFPVKIKTSIASIVVAVIVVLVSLFLCLVGFMGYGLYNTREKGELNSFIAVQADQAATALAPALWNFDQAQVEQTVESFMKDNRVYAISVKDNDSLGMVITMVRDADWKPVKTEKRIKKDGFLGQERDIHYRGKFVGTITMIVSPAFLEKNLHEIRLMIPLIIIVTGSLLTLALYFLLWRIALKPIKILEKYALSVRHGADEPFKSPTIPFLGELESLRVSITEMIDKLKNRNAKLQEQAIKIGESEAFRKRIFDSSHVPIVIMDSSTFTYIDCNPAAVEIYRFPSREEVLGKGPMDFSAPVQYDGVLSSEKARFFIEKAMAEGAVVFEWRHQRPDGKMWDAEVHLMGFESGNKGLLQFTLQDITERKLAEEALRESKSRLRAIFDSSRDAIGVAKNGKHIYANPAYLELFGFANNEQILGTSIINSIAPSHRERMVERVQRRSAGEDVEKFYESRGMKTDGAEFDAEFSLSTYTMHGETYSVASIRDITERKRAREVLRESEAKFEMTFRSAPYAMSITLLSDAKIVDVNEKYIKLVGYTAKELLNHSVTELNIWSDPPQRERLVVELLKNGQIRDVECAFRRKSGETFTALLSSVIVNMQGKQYILSSTQDITERKRAEALLRESEERYRRLLESVSSYVYTVDICDGKAVGTRHGEGCVAVTGYAPEEFNARKDLWISMVPFEDRNLVLETVNRILTENQPQSLEHRIIPKNGTIRWISATLVPHFDEKGHISSYDGIVSDISERKSAEEDLKSAHQQVNALNQQLSASNQQLSASNTELTTAYRSLAEREARFTQLADSISEIFWLFDIKSDKFVYVNKAFESIWGWPVEDAFALSPLDPRHIVPEDRSRWLETALKLKDGLLDNAAVEFRIKRKDGAVRWLRTRISAIRDDRGSISRIAAITADVTIFKEAAEKERMHSEQLQQADKMASLGVLVSGVAHEVNNPNNFIMLNTPLLKDAWDQARPILERHFEANGEFDLGGIPFSEMRNTIPTLFQGIEDGSRRIKKIVEDLKNFARKDLSNFDNSVDVGQVVREAISLLTSMINKKTDKFSLTMPRTPVCIKGNKQKLEQVVINLLHNACDALESKDKAMEVRVEGYASECIISVIDQGKGISKSDLSHLAEPFFTNKRDMGGTGLGLSVSAGIVKDHNGKLLFESEVGKGTTAKVVLPIAREKAEQS